MINKNKITMSTQIKERESGIELLRILAALGVVFSHFLNGGAVFDSESISFVNYLVLTFLRSITISSVDIFIIITGYYMCSSQVRSVGKPLNLLLQVSFCGVILATIFYVAGFPGYTVKKIVTSAIPLNWFITLYVVIYIISPYLNVVYRNLASKKLWTVFIIMMIILFSIWPSLLGVAQHFGYPLDALSTYGRGGNNAGYTIVNFVTLYSIGAFLRVNEIEGKIKNKVLIIFILFCVIILWGMRFIPINTTPWHIAGWYDNIFVILLSVFLFLLFKQFHFRNRIINNLAKASFTCFIIHGFLLGLVNQEKVLSWSLVNTLGYIFVFLCVTYMIAWCLYQIYTICFRRVFTKLEGIKFTLI